MKETSAIQNGAPAFLLENALESFKPNPDSAKCPEIILVFKTTAECFGVVRIAPECP